MLDCESINSSSPLGLDLGFLLLFERKSILFKSRRLSGSFQSTRQIIEARWSAIESWRTVGRKENFDHLPTTLGSLFDFFCFGTKGGLRLFLLRMRIQNHFLSLSSDLILSEILQVFDWRCCVWPEPGCEPGSSEFLFFFRRGFEPGSIEQVRHCFSSFALTIFVIENSPVGFVCGAFNPSTTEPRVTVQAMYLSVIQIMTLTSCYWLERPLYELQRLASNPSLSKKCFLV